MGKPKLKVIMMKKLIKRKTWIMLSMLFLFSGSRLWGTASERSPDRFVEIGRQIEASIKDPKGDMFFCQRFFFGYNPYVSMGIRRGEIDMDSERGEVSWAGDMEDMMKETRCKISFADDKLPHSGTGWLDSASAMFSQKTARRGFTPSYFGKKGFPFSPARDYHAPALSFPAFGEEESSLEQSPPTDRDVDTDEGKATPAFLSCEGMIDPFSDSSLFEKIGNDDALAGLSLTEGVLPIDTTENDTASAEGEKGAAPAPAAVAEEPAVVQVDGEPAAPVAAAPPVAAEGEAPAAPEGAAAAPVEEEEEDDDDDAPAQAAPEEQAVVQVDGEVAAPAAEGEEDDEVAPAADEAQAQAQAQGEEVVALVVSDDEHDEAPAAQAEREEVVPAEEPAEAAPAAAAQAQVAAEEALAPAEAEREEVVPAEEGNEVALLAAEDDKLNFDEMLEDLDELASATTAATTATTAATSTSTTAATTSTTAATTSTTAATTSTTAATSTTAQAQVDGKVAAGDNLKNRADALHGSPLQRSRFITGRRLMQERADCYDLFIKVVVMIVVSCLFLALSAVVSFSHMAQASAKNADKQQVLYVNMPLDKMAPAA